MEKDKEINYEKLASDILTIKDSDPARYKEVMSQLTSANTEKSKKLLGIIGETAARQRKGYEGLQEFAMAATGGAPAIVGSYIPKAIGSMYNGSSMFDPNSPGIVTKNFQENHPIWSGAANLISGILSGGGLEYLTRNKGIHNQTKHLKNSNQRKVPSLDANSSDVVHKNPAKDYPKSESLLAERIKTGATERVPWLNGQSPEELYNYIQKYVPLEPETIGVGGTSEWDGNIVLMNRNTPKKFYSSDRIWYGTSDDLPLNAVELSDVFDHEMGHHLQQKFLKTSDIDPEIFNIIPKDVLKGYLGFLRNPNTGQITDEITPRIIQVKNFLEIKNGKQLLTGEQLKKGFVDYAFSRFDNSMLELYESVKDWDKLAKWANKMVPASAGVYMINENDNKRE